MYNLYCQHPYYFLLLRSCINTYPVVGFDPLELRVNYPTTVPLGHNHLENYLKICKVINGRTTLSITTLGIMTFSITINKTQHSAKQQSVLWQFWLAKFRICWVSQISPLDWMLLFWVSICWVMLILMTLFG